MPKKSTKLEELSQTHGKLENIQHKTLDQIWGDNGSSKYKTLNLQDYLNYLNDMNKSDLQNHAKKIGLIPVDNRETLTKRLVSEFKKFNSLYKLPKNKEDKTELNKETKNILSEGK
jgi:hypothetical protein